MARVNGIIAAGLSAAATGGTSLEAQAQPQSVQPTQGGHEPILEQIRARSQRIQDAQSTAPNAELALSSGLAGLGAASVFGPAGLLVGGIVQMLGKRRLNNMRELATQDAEASTAAIERGRTSLNNALEQATTDAERAEVAMHIERFEQLEALTTHPDPNLRSQAMMKMLDVTGQLDTELEEVETRRLDAESRQRDQFQFEVQEANSVRDELQTDFGKDWNTRLDSYGSMLAVEDTAFGDQTLIIRAMKMNDPNSAVLPGEAATASNAAGVPDILMTTYNRLLRDGERLSPEQRADIVRQSGLIVNANKAIILDANTQAAERLRARGVRDDLITSTMLRIPNADQLPLPRNSERLGESDIAAIGGPDNVRSGRRPVDNPEEELGLTPEQLRSTDNLNGAEESYADILVGSIRDAGDFWARTFADQERRERGATLRIDPNTGREFEVGEGGETVELDTTARRREENRARAHTPVELTPEAQRRAEEAKARGDLTENGNIGRTRGLIRRTNAD